MKRTSVYLTDAQLERLHAYVERTGLKFSEVLRRLVDDALRRLPPEAQPTKKKEA